jgi:hypothetical protein
MLPKSPVLLEVGNKLTSKGDEVEMPIIVLGRWTEAGFAAVVQRKGATKVRILWNVWQRTKNSYVTFLHYKYGAAKSPTPLAMNLFGLCTDVWL